MGVFCQNVFMNSLQPLDDKKLAIIDAGFRSFAAYGYRRVSMAEIAKAAGMSRAALYLHFSSKEDIFRSLVVQYFAQAAADLQAALQADGALDAVICGGFQAVCGPGFKAMMTSPHGPELMDSKNSVGAELARAGDAQLLAIWAGWLRDQGALGRVVLDGPAEEVAQVLMAALHGIKEEASDWDALQAGMGRLARLMARGLRA